MSYTSFFDYPGEEGGERPAPIAPPPAFLAELDDAGWDRLVRHLQVRRLRPGEIAVRPGDAERALLIVADGELEELSGRPGSPVVLGAGAVAGELPFFDGLPSTTTVRARTDVDLLVLGVDAFDALAAREPVLARMVLFDLGRLLAARVRAEATI